MDTISGKGETHNPTILVPNIFVIQRKRVRGQGCMPLLTLKYAWYPNLIPSNGKKKFGDKNRGPYICFCLCHTLTLYSTFLPKKNTENFPAIGLSPFL